MEWWKQFAAELTITLSDGVVWFSIGQALLFSGVCVTFGTWAARRVGLLDPHAPAAETVGVGLASGLMVLAAWWAALASGGRSSFTPVAIGFAISIALALFGPKRGNAGSRSPDNRDPAPAILLGGGFIVAVALLYGSTLTLSPREGVQPLEFMDEAFYSILGADLARTGTETVYSPSGFSGLDALPPQAWYHWGEIWLASAVIKLLGTEPLLARHLIVLPAVLLACAAMTGTLVRRFGQTRSPRAFIWGFIACLFLAPVPLIYGTWFSSWAVGLIFGVTGYGLAAVAILFAMYGIIVLGPLKADRAVTGFIGSAVALIVPAHVVLAMLALVGAGSVWAILFLRSLVVKRRLPDASVAWQRTLLWAAVAIVMTLAWGLLTGHRAGGPGASASDSAFNAAWRESALITVAGAGIFFAIAGAWVLTRRAAPFQAGLYVGTGALLMVGVVAWGARMGDYNMFHLFFGGLVAFGTPVAAIATWSVWTWLRDSGRPLIAFGLAVVCVLQIQIGVPRAIMRLQTFGPHAYAPVPIDLIEAIKLLPPDAKLAYSCRPFEEIAFWDSRLLAIDARTGRRVVPMCFQADIFGTLTGAPVLADIPSPLFQFAPQHALYPDSTSRPSPERVATFLDANGIDYIYADSAHPNSLVPEATVVASVDGFQLLKLP